jgi:SAM-dependent methyltransferase
MPGNLLQVLLRTIRQWSIPRDNVRIQREYPELRFPPCNLVSHALNHCNYRHYQESGLAHARFIMQTIRNHSSVRDLAVCEWGCGPGRIIQHLPALDHGIARLIGTDCNAATIEWCRANLPATEFLLHALQPPLPLASASLDVVYCCAVFTHLGELLHHSWAAEILRLLRPGGLLIASFHGSCYEDRLAADELAESRNGNLITHANAPEGETGFASFASDRFVRERLLQRFTSVTRLDNTPFLQTVWTAIAPGA